MLRSIATSRARPKSARRAGMSKSNLRRIEGALTSSGHRRSETRRLSSRFLTCVGREHLPTSHLNYQRCLRSKNGFRIPRRRLR
ncbi:hypothetical protein BD311DRAFT_660197 [Dichomitus squalens]|uniref:Uncharacterized protein n=1 Tax=Dichomitus squalens TaxID=114155 RepID=A0A4Q9MQ02_9APHY|nr:hypothetical protein BD311DRAFT_660197 [Dichomitus squalens]